jgi:hypothetical protein
MNKKTFQKFIDRDGGCYHCDTTETIVPHHRANRGMGGSKIRDVPSNIITLCSEFNGLIESNATLAELARAYGWKLTAGQDPKLTPVFARGRWWLLDDNFGRVQVEGLDGFDSD